MSRRLPFPERARRSDHVIAAALACSPVRQCARRQRPHVDSLSFPTMPDRARVTARHALCLHCCDELRSRPRFFRFARRPGFRPG